MKPPPPRLIDLHTDWILQYALETTLFDPVLYARIKARHGQAEGYLQASRVAFLSCYRCAQDWANQADPWAALGDLIARIEAEFCGRLLFGPDDLGRCLDEPESLCWGLVGVEGFDALIRAPGDLARLPGLFARGVRLFQPVYTATSVLGGSSTAGDDRGLTDLGYAFLGVLDDLGRDARGPHPLFDLAHLNPRATGDALAWFEADADRPRRVIPVYSHGALAHPGFDTPRAISLDNLGRLRALGGVAGFSVGPPFYESPEALRASLEAAAALPFQGRAGFEGLAIGTDFLGVDHTLPTLSHAAQVVAWLEAAFDPETARSLIEGNGRLLLERTLGLRRD